MPQGKKPRTSSKKNKGKQQRASNAGRSVAPRAVGSSNPAPNSRSLPNKIRPGDLPTEQELNAFVSSRESSSFGRDFRSLYVRYKAATKRYVDALRAKVPPHVFAENTVQSLIDAVDYLADSGVAIEAEMIRDLKLALKTRIIAARSYGHNSDKGHEYFNWALYHGWVKLRKKQLAKRPAAKSDEAQSQQESFINMFENLMTDPDADDVMEDDMEEFVKDMPKAMPSIPPRLLLEELIKGDDRMAASFFLLTLDEAMKFISMKYAKTKDFYQTGKRDGYPPFTVIGRLLTSATMVNFSIQLVSMLEFQIAADFPHMNTTYRLLAVIVLPELAQALIQLVSHYSPKASEFMDKCAYEFLGDVMESGFRTASDPKRNPGALVKDFAEKWRVPANQVEQLAQQVDFLIAAEAPHRLEVPRLSAMLGREFRPYSWLSKSNYIGGARSITSTLRLVQGVGTVIHNTAPNNAIMSKEGMFGRQWDDRIGTSKIAGDMDEFLMADILPLLHSMCTMSLLSHNLPYERELLTFFNELKGFFKSPLQPVSWSLVFGVHALLTSVYEVQGEVENIGAEAKICYNRFMEQIDWCLARGDEGRSRHHSLNSNLKLMQKLQYLPHPIFPPQATPSQKQRHESHAIWNPLCAGSFLLFLSYFGNLDGGTSTVDSFAQLRMVLHLYNALLRNNLLAPGQLEILDWLSKTFQGSRAVWEGPLPNKGEIVYRWWSAYGVRMDAARRRSENTKKIVQGDMQGHADANLNPGDEVRSMNAITPQEISKSFRRICLHDFTNLEDRYHTPEQRKHGGHTDFYQHAVRLNDTLDAMEADARLLATNLSSLGEIIDSFIEGLFRVVSLEPVVKKYIDEMPESIKSGRRADGRRPTRWETSVDNLERQAMVFLFAELILGPLDFHPSPETDERITGTIAFMEAFFTNINLAQIMYFMPTQEE